MEWGTIIVPTNHLLDTILLISCDSICTPSTVLLQCAATERKGLCDSTQPVSIGFNDVGILGFITVASISLLTLPLTALWDLNER